MTGPDTPPSVPQDQIVTAALAPMAVIAEAVVGYHRKLTDGGISEEFAGRMAETYHTTLMQMVQNSAAVQALKSAADSAGFKRKDNR